MGDGPADDAKASRQADDPGQSDVPPADGVPEDLRKSLGRFHLIAVTEAVTYLALVSASVAHRVFGAANLVPAVGLVHGTVFLVYLAASFRLRRRLNWDTVTMIIIVLASVVPFGTLVVERRIARSPFSPKLPGVPERPSVIAHSASQQTTGLADPTADPRS
ncbi:MAG TPA: DUF3817 domain-containing protein, partial [Microthrixaceae bacterium]|nr:DUF3817 domain-containing protein [Microthrixaceae bacterium]